jgi:hypothetical protein
MDFVFGPMFSPLMFQWGRDQLIAELMIYPTTVSSALRFNGAAIN